MKPTACTFESSHEQPGNRSDAQTNPAGTGIQPDPSNAELVVRRFMSNVLERGDVRQIPELVAPDYVGHLGHGDYYGPEGARIVVAMFRNALPDLTVHLDDLLTCGDRVTRRFTITGTHLAPLLGHPPTGEQTVLRGIGIDRVAQGRLQESWLLVEIVPRAPPTHP
ncbi:MAG: ester cyclase [Thermomicrobiales bacterium]